MRLVLDTNIFIAAVLKNGSAEDIIKLAATTNLATIISSEEILTELSNKLESKFNWDEPKINFYISTIREICEIVKPKEKLSIIKRDPSDNKILGCALAGNANLVISSDQDLIKLKSFQGIAIIHPKTLTWTLPEYFKKIKN